MLFNCNQSSPSGLRVPPFTNHHAQDVNAWGSDEPPETGLEQLNTWVNHIIENGYAIGDMAMQTRMLDRCLKLVCRLPTAYCYSDLTDLFVEACSALGLLHVSPNASYFYLPGIATIEQAHTEKLLDYICQCGRQRSFAERRRLRCRAQTALYEEYCQYIQALFEANDRLIVLRLDLGYASQWGISLPLTEALSDLNQFFVSMRDQALFNGKVGFIVKTEYGLAKGIHFHLILFFNGSQRNGTSHCYLAQQIGEYWKQISASHEGIYWNCNAQVNDFARLDRLGIGLIHWNEMQTRKNLCDYVLAYVCKHEQGLRCHYLPRARLIRRGSFPVPNSTGVGRPRKMVGD